MLAPDTPDVSTQVIDVRDLAERLLRCALNGTIGTYNAVGPVLPFGDWLALSRHVGGHTGPVTLAPAGWLLEQDVEEYMGEESLAMLAGGPGGPGVVQPIRRSRADRRSAAPGPRGAVARRARLGARAGLGPAARSGAERAA